MTVLKNIGALVAGFAVVVILSTGTDFILESLHIFPPPSAYADATWMLAFALFYRTLYTVLGGYVTAWLAPSKPMRLVYILGVLGTLGGIGGTVAGWNLSAHWYPIALAVLAFPSVWLGGWLFQKPALAAKLGLNSVIRSTAAGKQEITITRIFDSNRQKVWDMWTKPEKLCQWFGVPPVAATPETTSIDLRVGGKWRADMVNAADGTKLPFSGTYLEIDTQRKLVFTIENPASPDFETVTVTFMDHAGTTEMKMHQAGHLPPEQYGAPLQNGYNAFFERMSRYLRIHND